MSVSPSFKRGGWLRGCFPTNRRLLTRAAVREHAHLAKGTTLVLGAGHDPYKRWFLGVPKYIRIDLVPSSDTDVAADVLDLPFASQAADTVVATEVLEHVRSPERMVNEIYRVLRPGGVCMLSVPFVFHVHGDPSDYWRPTYQGLRHLFIRFTAAEITPQGNRFHSVCDLITTAFPRTHILAPLRIGNHVTARLFAKLGTIGDRSSTAPTGYFLIARK